MPGGGPAHGWRRIRLLGAAVGLACAAGCGPWAAPAAPPPTAALVAGWRALPTSAEAAALAGGPVPLRLADLAAYWHENFGTWALVPGRWRSAGRLPALRPPRGWSWQAAALAAGASGFAWPRSAVVDRASVRVVGAVPWTLRASGLTIWAAVRQGAVVACWVTFHVGLRAVVTVADEGPSVLTLPYWTQALSGSPAAGLAPAARAAVPAGAVVLGVGRAPGAPDDATAVTLAEGMAAVEALVVPLTDGRWGFLPLGPVGSALAAPPVPEWENLGGTAATALAVRFAPGGRGEGLALFGVTWGRGAWRAAPLFVGDGDLLLDVRRPGGRHELVIALVRAAAAGGAEVAYQAVVWRGGAFRLGPGLAAPVATGLAPGELPARRAPEVVGLAVPAAVRRLGAAGLAAGIVPLDGVRGPVGRVLAQEPAPGAPVGADGVVRLLVAVGVGALRGVPPPFASLRLLRPVGPGGPDLPAAVAGPTAVRAWWQALAWALRGRPPVERVVRGPGDLPDAAPGPLLVATFRRPWVVRVPDAGTGGVAEVRATALALSADPLYAGTVLLRTAGRWVAAVRLPASRFAWLRASLTRLATSVA